MRNNVMTTEFRDCPHCHKGNALAYYREAIGNWDIYYCQFCFGIVRWNGQEMQPMKGEAYPNREKSHASE